MQGGRFTTDDQLDYRSYKCKIHCEPNLQNTLNTKTILKQLQDFKNTIMDLNNQITQIENNCTNPSDNLEARLKTAETTIASVLT